MMKRTAVLYSSPFLMLLVMCSLVLSVVNSYAGSKLHCDQPKYDFGTMIGQYQIVHEFVLKNKGDDPVKVLQIENCCGVTSTIIPMEIPPGSSAVCKVVFTTLNRYGKQDKQILIATNNRKKPYVELKMVGELIRPVKISPRIVYFGNLLVDSSFSQVVAVTNQLQKSIQLKSVSSSISSVRALVTESNERDWKIQLSTSEILDVGKLSGRIHLNFSSGTMNVPVVGMIKPIIQVVPGALRFSDSSERLIERLIMLRSEDDRPFDVLFADFENTEGSVEMKKLTDSRWQCRLSVESGSISDESALRVLTSCQSQPEIIFPLKKIEKKVWSMRLGVAPEIDEKTGAEQVGLGWRVRKLIHGGNSCKH